MSDPIVQDIAALKQAVNSVVAATPLPTYIQNDISMFLDVCLAELSEAEQLAFLRVWLWSHCIDPDEVVQL